MISSTIENIASVLKTGKTPPSKKSEYFVEDFNWYTPGDIGESKVLRGSERKVSQLALDEKKAFLYPENSLLITCIGNIGRVGIASEKVASNQQITAITPNENVDVNYLYYWFIRNQQLIENKANNAVVPILNNSTLKRIPISYPPLITQKRIATMLDDAQALKQKNEQLLKEYDELAQSIFLDMFGDPLTNPKGWEIEDFGNHIKVLADYHANGSYKTLSENVTLKDEKDFALMVRTTDLENQNFEKSVKYIDEKAYNYLNKTKVYGNEIIINKIGSAGKVYMMPVLNRPVSLGMNAFILRFKETVDNKFIYFQLLSHYGEREIKKRVKGAVTKTIRKDAVREIPLIIPPIILQNQFAEKIKLIEQQKELAKKELKESKDLFQALLQKAFNNTLNV